MLCSPLVGPYKNVFFKPQNFIHMKKVHLTIKEFYFFKTIATFFYDVSISKEIVTVKADRSDLELLGY
jgi:hypothetical protein